MDCEDCGRGDLIEDGELHSSEATKNNFTKCQKNSLFTVKSPKIIYFSGFCRQQKKGNSMF